jgi:hypothetical protein
MDDTRYRSFFLQPTEPLQRQYEVLRAVFVEQQSMQAAAQRFGYRADTVRALASGFRQRFAADNPPPFSPNRSADGLPTQHRSQGSLGQKLPPRLTSASSALPQADVCEPALPASSSSYRCWPASVSTNSSVRLATPAPE